MRKKQYMTAEELRSLIRETLERETEPLVPTWRPRRLNLTRNPRRRDHARKMATRILRIVLPGAIWHHRHENRVVIEWAKVWDSDWMSSRLGHPLRHILDWCREAHLDPQIESSEKSVVKYVIVLNIAGYRFRGN